LEDFHSAGAHFSESIPTGKNSEMKKATKMIGENFRFPKKISRKTQAGYFIAERTRI